MQTGYCGELVGVFGDFWVGQRVLGVEFQQRVDVVVLRQQPWWCQWVEIETEQFDQCGGE